MSVRRMWFAIAGALALAGACASSGEPAPEAPPSSAAGAGAEGAPPEAIPPEEAEETIECHGPPITPSFGWPAHLSAEVRSIEIVEMEDSRKDEPAREGMKTAHRLEVAPSGEGRLAVKFVAEGEGRPRLDGLLMEYGGVRPTLLLSDASGEVVGLEGVAAMRAEHARVKEEQHLPDEVSQQLLERLDPETLLADTRAWWHLALGGWDGRTIGCGEVQKDAQQVPVETLGAPVAMSFEWRYLGSLPCDEESGRGGQTCAELLVVGSAESDVTRDLLQKRIDAVGGARAQGIHVERAELVRLVRVRLEPKTMVLHGIRAEEHIASTFTGPDGKLVARRQSDMQTLAFRYGAGKVESTHESGDAGRREPGKSR